MSSVHRPRGSGRVDFPPHKVLIYSASGIKSKPLIRTWYRSYSQEVLQKEKGEEEKQRERHCEAVSTQRDLQENFDAWIRKHSDAPRRQEAEKQLKAYNQSKYLIRKDTVLHRGGGPTQGQHKLHHLNTQRHDNKHGCDTRLIWPVCCRTSHTVEAIVGLRK